MSELASRGRTVADNGGGMPLGGADHAEDLPDREPLEWISLRILLIADRCSDPATRHELMKLVDQCHSVRGLQLDEAYAELNIVQDWIPPGSSNRPGKRLVPTSITIHNADNSEVGADAAAHAKYQKSADASMREVSWHFTV